MRPLSRSDYEAYLRRLAAALKRLQSGQGETARRNARQAVAAEIRRLKGAVDTLHPAPPRRPGKRRSTVALTPAGRLAVWKRGVEADGFVMLEPGDHGSGGPGLVIACAEAGVRIRSKTFPTEAFNPGTGRGGLVKVHAVPAWVKALGADPSKLRKAKHDIATRKAMVVEKTLAQPAQNV